MKGAVRRHPDWIRAKLPAGQSYNSIKSMLRKAKLHTVCEEARCPNIGECFCKGTATFMILGDVCDRGCKYCNVKQGTPTDINPDEPRDVAESVKKLGLKYAVITSVTRDDLEDYGAGHFARTIKEIKKLNPSCRVEVLIPDFKGNVDCLKTVIDANPDVINHNIEVVKSLFPSIRPNGNYEVSLKLLKNVKILSSIKSKSGMMIGLGEKRSEIIETLKDLKEAGVQIVTIGQYLQPSKNHIKVEKYYLPEEFEEFKKIGEEMGFLCVASAPLVRSSYYAESVFEKS